MHCIAVAIRTVVSGHFVCHISLVTPCPCSIVLYVLFHCAAVVVRFLSIIIFNKVLEMVFLNSQTYVPSDTHCSFHIKASLVKTRMVHLGMCFLSSFLPDFLLYTIFLCSTSKSHTDWDPVREKATIHYLPFTKDAH
jgi:hypothetical protein